MLRGLLTTLCCATVLALQSGNAWALHRGGKAPKRKVVIRQTVTGPKVKCHRWGYLTVRLKVIETVITRGKHRSVRVKIADVSWPVYPDHTPRSKYINAQALPLLREETLQLQAQAGRKLQNISGATQTTVSWRQSLQGALREAEKLPEAKHTKKK